MDASALDRELRNLLKSWGEAGWPTDEPFTIMDSALARLQHLLDVSHADIYTFSRDLCCLDPVLMRPAPNRSASSHEDHAAFQPMSWLVAHCGSSDMLLIRRAHDVPDDAASEIAWFDREGLEAAVFVPIRCRGALTGAMVLATEQVDPPWLAVARPHLVRLAASLGSSETCWRPREHAKYGFSDKLMRVMEAAEALGRSKDRDALHRSVVEQAVHTLGLESCSLYLLQAGEYFRAGTAGRAGGTEANLGNVLARPLLPSPAWFETLAAGGPRWTLLEDVPDPGVEARPGSAPPGWVVVTAAWAEDQAMPPGLLLNDAATTQRPVDGLQQEALSVFASMVGNMLLRCDAQCTDRQAEAQRYQAERMEALAGMAGVVAHDLNNLLMPVIGYSKMVADQLEGEDAIRSDALEILRAGEEVSELAARLLAIGPRRMKSVGASNLRQVIFRERGAFQDFVGDGIRIEIHMDDALPDVQIDAVTLTEVVGLLLANARDALPDGGRVHISAQPCALDDTFCRRHVQIRPGAYVHLRIEDEGCGMSEEISMRAFDPFFTTRSQSRGAGLGLSTVYGAVRQCGGCIRLDSFPDRGTRIDIFLPPALPDQDPPPPAAPPISKGGEETILVVEDEHHVREVIVRMLKSLGYEVLAAADGLEALAMAERHPDGLHLVLTDIVMPGLGGRETVRKLKALRDDFRVLYMSGYADADLGDPDADILRKPFTDETLGARVRIALDR